MLPNLSPVAHGCQFREEEGRLPSTHPSMPPAVSSRPHLSAFPIPSSVCLTLSLPRPISNISSPPSTVPQPTCRIMTGISILLLLACPPPRAAVALPPAGEVATPRASPHQTVAFEHGKL